MQKSKKIEKLSTNRANAEPFSKRHITNIFRQAK